MHDSVEKALKTELRSHDCICQLSRPCTLVLAVTTGGLGWGGGGLGWGGDWGGGIGMGGGDCDPENITEKLYKLRYIIFAVLV